MIVPLSPLNNSQNQDGQGHATEENNKTKSKKKQVRLLLDARTELTNEELEVRVLTSSALRFWIQRYNAAGSSKLRGTSGRD